MSFELHCGILDFLPQCLRKVRLFGKRYQIILFVVVVKISRKVDILGHKHTFLHLNIR